MERHDAPIAVLENLIQTSVMIDDILENYQNLSPLRQRFIKTIMYEARKTIATNLNTPNSLLEKINNDENFDIRRLAKRTLKSKLCHSTSLSSNEH